MVDTAQSIRVVDNFVTEEEYKGIYDAFMGDSVPWFFNGSVNYGGGPVDSKLYDYQFTHTMYLSGRVMSPLLDGIGPILNKLDIKALVRVKANLIPRADTIFEHDMHTDFPFNANTAIFYVNSNNGYTKFKVGKTVQSVGNRIAMFPTLTEHCGTTCTDSKIRVAININYF
jgi:hypothetical protein